MTKKPARKSTQKPADAQTAPAEGNDPSKRNVVVLKGGKAKEVRK